MRSWIQKFLSFIINRHQNIFRILLILITIILIVDWIPKISKFKYEFEIGKPWKHQNLIAPFDFAIHKSLEEIEEEKNAIEETFFPYYSLRKENLDKQVRLFEQNITQEFSVRSDELALTPEDSLAYIQYGLRLLDTLYNTGILILNEEHRQEEQFITLLKDNQAEVVRASSLLTIREAIGIIRNTLEKQNHLNPYFLIPLLESRLEYNVSFDKETNDKVLTSLLNDVSETRGAIQEGEIIIRTGQVIDNEKLIVLESFKSFYEEHIADQRKGYQLTLGYFVLIAIIMGIFTTTLIYFSPNVFFSTRKLGVVLLLILGMSYIFHWAFRADVLSYYIIPFCIVPIIVRSFFGNRLALNIHIAIVLISGFMLPEGIVFMFLQIAAGMVAIFANMNTRYWSQFFISTGLILLTYIIGFTGISLIQGEDLNNIDWDTYLWLCSNVFLTLLAYPMIALIERTFGLISDIKLVELADLNKPLLKKLSLKAPGTFQHSLQVSNLSEAAANEIGANPMLVKVGALYHDIGKTDTPQYFIENQNTEVNPHDGLTFEQSAQIIIGHVIKGIEKAKKEKLPDIVIDFIRSHHGTSRVEYFYRSFLNNFSEEEMDESKFRYPGPKPYSKETAIVMMADSVEAASRSLKNPTVQDIENLVEQIIDYKIAGGQFDNSDITFKDITAIKKIFINMLKNIYHIRVAYPQPVKKIQSQ